MIPKYVSDWITIIEQMQNDNTYKLAWGRAIVECNANGKIVELNDNVLINLEDIAECMLKYYWNQMFFFNLKQSPYVNKIPKICVYTSDLIDYYKEKVKDNIPVWFNIGQSKIALDKEYTATIKHIKKVLPENVAWRFMNIQGKAIPLYVLDSANGVIVLKKEYSICLKEYGGILTKLLNYKWAQLLEKFNFAPRIVEKVNGISELKIKRNSLQKFKEELLKQYTLNPLDFYTGEELANNNISIDHVIPWSFMYSDDIWNLVITSKSNNSIKSNTIPSEYSIDRLKRRNIKLVDIVDSPFKEDLIIANENDYVDKFYNDLKVKI